MKRVAVLCLAMLMLLLVVLAGCKSGSDDDPTDDVPEDQKALGADLMSKLPPQPGGGGTPTPSPDDKGDE